MTKAFQGTGIELLVKACRGRFSFVRRFSPIASRNASSEVYLVCKNKKPNGSISESSPIAEITTGLEKLEFYLQNRKIRRNGSRFRRL